MSPAILAFSSAITAPSSTPMASEFSPSAGPAGTIGAASPGCSSAGAVEPIAPAPDRDRRPGPRPALRTPAAGGLPGQGPEAQATAPGHAVRGVAGWIDGRSMKTGSVCARTTSGIIDAIHVGPNDRSIDGRRCNEPARVQSQRRSRAAKPIIDRTRLSVDFLPGPRPEARTGRSSCLTGTIGNSCRVGAFPCRPEYSIFVSCRELHLKSPGTYRGCSAGV